MAVLLCLTLKRARLQLWPAEAEKCKHGLAYQEQRLLKCDCPRRLPEEHCFFLFMYSAVLYFVLVYLARFYFGDFSPTFFPVYFTFFMFFLVIAFCFWFRATTFLLVFFVVFSLLENWGRACRGCVKAL